MKNYIVILLLVFTPFIGRSEASEPIIDTEIGVVIDDIGCPWDQDESGKYKLNRTNLNLFVANYKQTLWAQSESDRSPLDESLRERVQSALLTVINPFPELPENARSPLEVALAQGLNQCVYPGVARFAPDDVGNDEYNRVVWFLNHFTQARGTFNLLFSIWTDSPFRDRQNAIFKAEPEFEKQYSQWFDVARPLIQMIATDQLELGLQEATNTIGSIAAYTELALLTGIGVDKVLSIPIIATRTTLTPVARAALITFVATEVSMNIMEAPALAEAIRNHEYHEKSIMRVIIDHELRIFVHSVAQAGLVAFGVYEYGTVAHRNLFNSLSDETRDAAMRLHELSQALGH